MRPWMFAVLVALFVQQTFVRTANAQGTEEGKRLHYSGALFACVADVRRQSASDSQFSAYTTKTGELRAWGTEYEFYLFEKCMKKQGYDTQLRPARR